MHLQVPLEARLGGQPGRVEGLDRGEVRPVGGEFRFDRLAAAIAEFVVTIVDAEPRREGGLLLQESSDARLDEVVESVVERAGIGRRGRARERRAESGRSQVVVLRATGLSPVCSSGASRQAEAPMGSGSSGRGLVSASTSRTAAMVVSMSVAVTP